MKVLTMLIGLSYCFVANQDVPNYVGYIFSSIMAYEWIVVPIWGYYWHSYKNPGTKQY